MAQTRLTCDVSSGGKVKAQGVTSMIRHWARDVDARNGIYYNHSNEGIDRSRSINNETWFPTDGPRSTWKQPSSTEEIQSRLEGRLATVTGRKRKDAVVMRGVVLGLSPEWVEAHTPNWKTDSRDREKFMDTLQPAVDRVIEKAGGAKNVILVTGHFDEVVPQIQMAVTPVTEDGRLRQNDFDLFKSGGSLRQLHKQIREDMKASGVDVIMESSERSREHLSNHDYARKADKERAQEIAYVEKKHHAIEADRVVLLEMQKKIPELKREAVQDGYALGHKRGYEAGSAKGREDGNVLREEGRKDGNWLRDQGQRRADEIIRDAYNQVAALRREREEMENEKREKAEELQAISDAVTAKYDELQRLRQEVEAVESSRDDMKQVDSDFLDQMLKYENVQERYKQFKRGRTVGLAAITDTKNYEHYTRTVGENRQLQQQQQRATGYQQQRKEQHKSTHRDFTPDF